MSSYGFLLSEAGRSTFSPTEKSCFISLVREFDDAINPKTRGADADHKRREAWETIRLRLQSKFGVYRSVESLKVKWNNEKARAKAAHHAYKRCVHTSH